MKIRATCSAPTQALNALLKRLHHVEGWPSWVVGLASVEVMGSDARLVWSDSLSSVSRVRVTTHEWGVSMLLVEGEFLSLCAELRVTPSDDALLLCLEAQVDRGLTIPGPLARELEERYGASVLSALLASSS